KPTDKDKLPGLPARASCRAKLEWRPRSASSVGSAAYASQPSDLANSRQNRCPLTAAKNSSSPHGVIPSAGSRRPNFLHIAETKVAHLGNASGVSRESVNLQYTLVSSPPSSLKLKSISCSVPNIERTWPR